MTDDRLRLVLASASPRRVEALRGLGLEPLVRPAEVDESPLDGEAPERYVVRLARAKASASARPGELVLGADTIVVLDGELLGKPGDRTEARSMLARLSGRVHEVLTGVALFEPDTAPASSRTVDTLVRTRVRMAPMTAEQIAWYVDTGEPMDKAGAYAIQGLGALFVEAIEGNYSNVVGLPLPAVAALCRDLGYDLLKLRGR